MFATLFLDAIKLNLSTSGSQCNTDNFGNMRYVPSNNTEDILLDNACDPGISFFNANFHNLSTSYILSKIFENFQNLFRETPSGIFSIHHLNLKSIKKIFDNFDLFLLTIHFYFSITCFSAIYLENETVCSSYELPNYIGQHQVKSDPKGGRVSICILKSLTFKISDNVNITLREKCPNTELFLVRIVLYSG